MGENVFKDPLEGMTLQGILEELVERHGWPWLAERVYLRCFVFDPSISSSLAFLRQTPWAREKLTRLYVSDHRRLKRNARRKWRKAAKQAHDAAAAAEDGSSENSSPAGDTSEGDTSEGADDRGGT